MKAVLLHGYGDVDQLRYEDAPDPKPAEGEVLIKVGATSVNPIDWKVRKGYLKEFMPLEFPAILGRDVAGEVVRVGSNVSGFEAGQRVMGVILRGYAEYLTAKAEILTMIPEGLSIEQAGALPLVVITGSQLIERGVQPKESDTILVLGALGSVGRAAVYVAKQAGAKVIAGVRANQKTEAEVLGADFVVALDDDKEMEWLPRLDGIADTIGGPVLDKLIPKVLDGGVVASVVGKPKIDGARNIRAEMVQSQPDAGRLRQLAEDVLHHRLHILVARTMKLSEAAEAQTLGEKGSLGGKIVLIP